MDRSLYESALDARADRWPVDHGDRRWSYIELEVESPMPAGRARCGLSRIDLGCVNLLVGK